MTGKKDKLGGKIGMWLFLFTEIMLFGGLFVLYAAYLSRYADDFKLWLDLTSAAQYLNKAPITIRRWIHSGRLPHYKMGGEYAFVKEELDQFISKNKG